MGEHLPEGEGLSEPAAVTPVFVIHSLAHAAAVLAAASDAGRAVVLLSAPDAGIYAGPGWFKALVQAARAAVPNATFSAMLDCGDDAGAAQGAIRGGIAAVIFTGRADVAERLAAIAASAGLRLLTRRPDAALDLGRWFFADGGELRRRCADALVEGHG